MLRFLRIRNLAVIEAVEVEFASGFTVLTGETGAGKSILVEAIGLLLGGRASSDIVRTGESHATIEAIFEDGDRELVVRREITSQGRSRAFVNGALATAAVLRDLSSRLVELHGQHEHQVLLDPAVHLPLLDSYGGLTELAARVAAAWEHLRGLREQLERSRMDVREKAARLDLIAFQLGEIEKAALRTGEDDELASAQQVLTNAERLRRLCDEGYDALYERDAAVLSQLSGVWKRVGELADIDPRFAAYLETRDSIKSQLTDLALFLRDYGARIDASPARLQDVTDRLALCERLKRKYGPELQDVMATGERLARERDLLSGGGERLEDLQRELASVTTGFLDTARELSRRRREAAVRFERALERLLADLAMVRTRFEVRFNAEELPERAWSERGIDDAEFFISPNPGEDVRPLARIVSGGELSRVMLALKTLATDRGGTSDARTVIFDEVDAGIGGRVADVVGTRLAELGDRFQVLCITHLPQIAAKATSQFRIEKHVRRDRTVATMTPLTPEARIDEIARMMGGTAVTDPLRASARELLGWAQRDAKPKAKGESESRRRV